MSSPYRSVCGLRTSGQHTVLRRAGVLVRPSPSELSDTIEFQDAMLSGRSSPILYIGSVYDGGISKGGLGRIIVYSSCIVFMAGDDKKGGVGGTDGAATTRKAGDDDACDGEKTRWIPRQIADTCRSFGSAGFGFLTLNHNIIRAFIQSLLVSLASKGPHKTISRI